MILKYSAFPEKRLRVTDMLRDLFLVNWLPGNLHFTRKRLRYINFHITICFSFDSVDVFRQTIFSQYYFFAPFRSYLFFIFVSIVKRNG